MNYLILQQIPLPFSLLEPVCTFKNVCLGVTSERGIGGVTEVRGGGGRGRGVEERGKEKSGKG